MSEIESIPEEYPGPAARMLEENEGTENEASIFTPSCVTSLQSPLPTSCS